MGLFSKKIASRVSWSLSPEMDRNCGTATLVPAALCSVPVCYCWILVCKPSFVTRRNWITLMCLTEQKLCLSWYLNNSCKILSLSLFCPLKNTQLHFKKYKCDLLLLLLTENLSFYFLPLVLFLLPTCFSLIFYCPQSLSFFQFLSFLPTFITFILVY